MPAFVTTVGTHLRTCLAGLALTMALALPASAQDARCNQWKAELASLANANPGGDRRAAAEARRVGGQLSQATARYNALGCNSGGFLFFGESSAQCPQLRAQIAELRASYGELNARGEGRASVYADRRAKLQSAIAAYCQRGVYQTPEPRQPRGFFETLFGIGEPRETLPPTMPELDSPLEPIDRKPRWGAGRPVCVRSCDGFFFPLPTTAGGRDHAEDMCQALCPASETKLFYIGSSGDIESAAGRDMSYSELPGAGRYLKSFDPACGCRKPGQSWASALAEAEDMLVGRKGDLIVSAQKAEELSRPRETKRDRDKRLATAKATSDQDAAERSAVEAAGAAAPTASRDSAGIGPRSIAVDKVVSVDQGQRREVTDAAGNRRNVRFVSPFSTQPNPVNDAPTGSVN